jgi:hypothetical protein
MPGVPGGPADPARTGDSGNAGELPATGDPVEIGEELMQVVARARSAGLEPELELRAAAHRLAERIRSWERSVG